MQKQADYTDYKGLFSALMLIIIGFSILFMLRPDAFYNSMHRIRVSMAQRKMEAAVREYREMIPKKMPELFSGCPIEGTLTVKGNAWIEEMVEYTYHTTIFYNYSLMATLETDASFDSLEEKEKYEYLMAYYRCVAEARNQTVDQYMPKFNDIEKHDRQGEGVYCDPWTGGSGSTIHYIVKTPSHEYEYSQWWKDERAPYYAYYKMDGSRIYIPGTTSASDARKMNPTPTNPNLEPTGYDDGKTCLVVLCNRGRVGSFLFCTDHKCCIHDCPRQRLKNDIYCQIHADEFKGRRNGGRYSSPGGGSGKSYDSYSTSGYSNAEDFADEWAEDFDSYEDAYEFYEEVTGHY